MSKKTLFLDTSSSKRVVLGLDEKRKVIKTGQGDRLLLKNLADFLKSNHCRLSSLGRIEINPGPGSFTGLRVGFSVANLLGWYLDIPVNNQRISSGNVALPKYD